MKEKKQKRNETRKTIKVMFCPRCKSVDVQREMKTTLIFGIPQQWKCNKCGFKGYVFPQREVDV